MHFLSLEPFVPSGSNFEASKQFFLALGFTINWDAGDYIGFEKDGCKFILQNFVNKEFAENFMVSVKINNAAEFWKEVMEKNYLKNLISGSENQLNNPMEKKSIS